MDLNLSNKSVKIMLFAGEGQSLGEVRSHVRGLNLFRADLIEVTSLNEAIHAYRTLHPDLIIATFSERIDEVRGLGFYVRERDGNRHTGFMVFCSHDSHEEGLAVKAFEAGADDFLNHSCPAREVSARISAVLRLKIMTDELRKANHKLEILSMTDDLTSLANMRSFNQNYSISFERVRRRETGLFVVMFDLDNFKLVNDTSNHLVGSALIREVAARLMGLHLRRGVFARYGGDEYIIYSESNDKDEAVEIAQKVRGRLNERPFEIEGHEYRITASVGSAYVRPGYDGGSDDAIKIADLGLYQSKRSGKDQVHSWVLGDLADFNHICWTYGVQGDAGGDDDKTAPAHHPRLLQKTG